MVSHAFPRNISHVCLNELLSIHPTAISGRWGMTIRKRPYSRKNGKSVKYYAWLSILKPLFILSAKYAVPQGYIHSADENYSIPVGTAREVGSSNNEVGGFHYTGKSGWDRTSPRVCIGNRRSNARLPPLLKTNLYSARGSE